MKKEQAIKTVRNFKNWLEGKDDAPLHNGKVLISAIRSVLKRLDTLEHQLEDLRKGQP